MRTPIIKYYPRLKELRIVPFIKIPTYRYENVVSFHRTSSLTVKDNQRKLSDMRPMIHDVLLSQAGDKSKHFMDLKMLTSFQEVMKQYNNMKLSCGPSKIPPVHIINKFIEQHFDQDCDIENWSPPDWVEDPDSIKSISDPGLKTLASHINSMWTKLGRRTNEDIKVNKDRHSITYVKNGFIVNSPELEEMVYWDSYWIIRGLLVCEMYSTAKGIIENLLQLLDQFGFVPKSNRIYHQDQTQIPMLILMVNEYFEETSDMNFVKSNIHLLEKELNFWKTKRAVPVTINNKSYTLYRYLATEIGPRPDHYKTDYIYLSSQIHVSSILTGLRAAEQSAWTRSSRWIDLMGENEGSITDIATENILPVDLNAILHRSMAIMASWFEQLGDTKKTIYFNQLADGLLRSINEVLWQKNLGYWCDYNFVSAEPRRFHYLSNFTPIWTNSYVENPSVISSTLLQYISDHKLYHYHGGVPVSLEFSGDPWDFPNVQPAPLAMFLEGMSSLSKEGDQAAFLLAEMWIDSVHKGFKDQQHIYNKYSCLKKGESDDDVQEPMMTGYGVTNGVIMMLLAKWGEKLKLSQEDPPQ